MSEDLPKQELLIKLLKMTTSPNEGEALIAMRKANALLTSAGWDWDKLIQGKIKVIEDPFKSVGEPYNPGAGNRTAPPPPSRTPQAPPPAAPQPPPRPQYTPPSPPRQPPPPPKPFEPYSHQTTNGQTNIYPGNCWACGHSVDARAGKLFIPSQFVSGISAKLVGVKKIICDSCDKDRFANISSRPAPQPSAPAPTPGLGDL
jgi:hypothetical protein